MRAELWHCPICEFTHGEVFGTISDGALASVFGPGVMAAVADAQKRQRIEDAMAAHLKTHELVEWLQAITDRNKRITELEKSLEQARMDMQA